MNSKIFFYTLILALLATACVSEFKANLPSNSEQLLVVDGTIMENTTVTFYLSKSFSINSTNIPPEVTNIDAKVTIIGSNGYESAPATNQGKGAYSINVGDLDDNVEYGIKIEYDGNTYQSALAKPVSTPDIDSISWVQPEKFGAVSFRVSTHDNTGEAKFFLWSYTENWEITANYEVSTFYNPATDTFYNVAPAPYYYCWKSNASHEFIIGSTESLSANSIINKELYNCLPEDYRFSYLYSVTVHQQAISKAAFEYYQNKIVINNEMGGLFTPQPSEVAGNITCLTDPSKKVIGYVEAVKNTTQKRIFVESYQISHSGVSDCTTITTGDVLEMCGSFLKAYQEGFRLIDLDIDGKPADWALMNCTECTANGGSKNKPDFWPNDDQ